MNEETPYTPVPQLTLYMVRSDTYQHDFYIVDAAGQPVDLTGATARMQIRADSEADAAILAATTGDGVTIDEANGIVTLDLPPTKTVALPIITKPNETMPVWDLELTEASGKVTTVVGGNVAVTADVTRDDVSATGGTLGDRL